MTRNRDRWVVWQREYYSFGDSVEHFRRVHNMGPVGPDDYRFLGDYAIRKVMVWGPFGKRAHYEISMSPKRRYWYREYKTFNEARQLFSWRKSRRKPAR